MAGKAINQYNSFTGLASAVNILVQEINQSDPNTFEHKKANLADMIKSVASVDDVVVGYYYNGTFYEESAHTTALPAVTGRIYIDLGSTPVELYHYTGTAYTAVTDNALRSALTGGTVTVDKATKDASGNTITTTYATKAEATAITDELQDAERVVESNSNRIANLEDKSQPFTIDYPSEDYGKGSVPANIANNANTVNVEGETGVTNQQVGNYASPSNTMGLTLSYDSTTGTLTVTGKPTSTGNVPIFSCDGYINGHTYLLAGFPSGLNGIKLNRYIGVQLDDTGSGGIATATSASVDSIGLVISSTDYTYNFSFKVIFRDLTPIFPKLTSAQITALGVAGVLALRPDLGKWNDYDAGSTITPMVTGMEARGVNIWDEEWEVGGLSSGGSLDPDNDRIRSKNYIPLQPNGIFYCKGSAIQNTGRICFYDAGKNFISTSGSWKFNESFTTPPNCAYAKFACPSAYGTTYNHDIQIAENSLPDSVKKTYHGYKHSEITFSEPVPMNGVGDARDKLNVGSGAIDRKMGSYTFTGNETISTGSGYYQIGLFNDIIKRPADGTTIPNILCPLYKATNWNLTADLAIYVVPITQSITNQVWIRDTTVNNATQLLEKLTGKTITYELATPTTSQISPSPTALEVEPYGEITVKQSQSIPLSLPFSMTYIPDSPYLMKKDVVDSLSSSATDLPLSANQGRIIKQTLDQHNARLTNLEEKAGDYVEVNYRGTDAVPTGKCKNALVNTIVHKTRPWNQLVDPTNLRTRESYNVSITNNNDGSITITTDGTASATTNLDITTNNFGIAGHKYLLFGGKTGYILVINDGNSVGTDSGSGVIFTAQASVKLQFPIATGQAYNSTIKPCVRDLTTILSDWSSSDITTANIPLMVQQIPDLLKWDAFSDGKTISTEVEGVKSIGVNIWDEEWVVGALHTDGNVYDVGLTNRRTTSFIPILPDTAYFQTSPTSAYGGRIAFYDGNKNFLYYDNNGIPTTGLYTSVQGAQYMRVTLGTGYGTTYNHDIQFCLYSLPSEIRTAYHPYMESTLTISPASTGHSAGSVADTDELCVEVEEGVYKRRKTTRTNKVDMGQLKWTYAGGAGHRYFRATVSDIKRALSVSVKANLTCPIYTNTLAINVYNNTTNKIIGTPDDNDILMVYDSNFSEVGSASDPTSFLGHLQGVELTYEIKTPTETLSDPIINNLITTEGGGTIRTKQTQGTEIDNSLDVGYLALGA